MLKVRFLCAANYSITNRTGAHKLGGAAAHANQREAAKQASGVGDDHYDGYKRNVKLAGKERRGEEREPASYDHTHTHALVRR